MKNVGKTDKIIRFFIALLLFSLFFILEGNLRYIAILGIVPLFTAITENCLLYKIFGINTRKK
ncbi:MAG: YgaP family membrane protein [Bacillota bacterium]